MNGTSTIARIIHSLELAQAAQLRVAAQTMAKGAMDRIRFLHEARNRVREAQRIRLFKSLSQWKSQ